MSAVSEEMVIQLDRERRERALAMPPAMRFLAGGELFEDACQLSIANIRHTHPHWTEDQILIELKRRIAHREMKGTRK